LSLDFPPGESRISLRRIRLFLLNVSTNDPTHSLDYPAHIIANPAI
jgi:hypothetical protein